MYSHPPGLANTFQPNLLSRFSGTAGRIGELRPKHGQDVIALALTARTCQALWHWLAVRPAVGREHVFVTPRHTPMNCQVIGYGIARYATQAGLQASRPAVEL